MEAEEHEGWLQILSNQTRKLHHGYYVTRLPSPKERGKMSKDLREFEKDWFTTYAPWNGKNMDKTRYGTAKLTEALSSILSKMITELYILRRHD